MIGTGLSDSMRGSLATLLITGVVMVACDRQAQPSQSSSAQPALAAESLSEQQKRLASELADIASRIDAYFRVAPIFRGIAMTERGRDIKGFVEPFRVSGHGATYDMRASGSLLNPYFGVVEIGLVANALEKRSHCGSDNRAWIYGIVSTSTDLSALSPQCFTEYAGSGRAHFYLKSDGSHWHLGGFDPSEHLRTTLGTMEHGTLFHSLASERQEGWVSLLHSLE